MHRTSPTPSTCISRGGYAVTIQRKAHRVVVVAEGAGEELVKKWGNKDMHASRSPDSVAFEMLERVRLART